MEWRHRMNTLETYTAQMRLSQYVSEMDDRAIKEARSDPKLYPVFCQGIVRGMYPCTALWWARDQLAQKKATILLDSLLTRFQRWCYHHIGFCWVKTEIGTFRLLNTLSPICVAKGLRRYCLQCGWVPVDDVKIAALMLLRSNPKLFLQVAGHHNAFH